MREKELRRSLAVLPIGTVRQLTDLSARQIRYYEAQGLIHPERTDTNRRMYSLNDVDRLLEIKDYLAEGVKLKTIEQRLDENEQRRTGRRPDEALTQAEIRRRLTNEFRAAGGFQQPPGEGPRF